MITRLTCWFALLCLFPIGLHAQSNEADLKARLMNKPLYLRGFWGDDNLSFDSAGHLTTKSYPVSFTLSGFDLKKITLRPDKLILDGRRMGLELAKYKQVRVPLVAAVTAPTEVSPHETLAELMHIEIAASPSGDYGPALDAIFVDGLPALTPLLPIYWSKYAHDYFLLPTNPPSPPQITKTNSEPGDTPPKPLHPVTVSASGDVSQLLQYHGRTRIQYWIKSDGTVIAPFIIRPVGLGRDERALAALLQTTYAPATKDGKPIPVQFETEIDFLTY